MTYKKKNSAFWQYSELIQKMDRENQGPEHGDDTQHNPAPERHDVPRQWAVDVQDPEIAVQLPGYEEAIPEERRRVYTARGFQHNPSYVNSDQSTETFLRRRSPVVNGINKEIIPDKFAGKIPWSDYKRHFDVCMQLNRWNDVDAGQFLATRLQGPALKVLNNIPVGRILTYTELVYQLDRRFGSGDQAENFLFELRMRRRHPKESLQELGQSIRDMSSLAYPELNTEARERLAKGHFSDAIDDPDIRAGIFRAHPVTLNDAIQAGLMTESFMKAERARERSRPPRHIRAVETSSPAVPVPVDNETRKEINEMKASLTQLMELMKHMHTTDKERSKDVICYNCQEKGHYRRDCPKPVQGNGQRPSRWTERRSGNQGPRA